MIYEIKMSLKICKKFFLSSSQLTHYQADCSKVSEHKLKKIYMYRCT